MECGGKGERLKTCECDFVGHAKRLDCGSIAAALESRGMAAAAARGWGGGVMVRGGDAAPVHTTTASS
jgi:hypothetical protein